MADRTLTINHADGGSETYTINRDKFAGVRDMTVDGETVSVDHTAVAKEQSKETTFGGSQSMTVKRDIEPLLSKVVGGASAAYSLRDLNDKAGNNTVVRVRRGSDNAERDFTASEMGKVLEDWVGVGNDGFLKTWYDQTESRTDDPQNITGFLVERSNDIMDGEWDKVADVNGKVAFTHEDDANRTLNWTGTRWEFKDSSTVYYYSTVDTTYPFDVSNEWVAVEGSGTPDFESFDGGWYDPLGRGGMLTMHAEIFQPTIVRNGTYLGEIDFDESNDKLNAHFDLDIDPADSGFASIVVARVDSTDTTRKQVLLQNSPSGSRHLIQWQPNGRYQFYAKDAEEDTKTFITHDSFGNDEYKVYTTTIDSNSLCRVNVNGFGEVNHRMNESVDFGSVDSTANSDEVISPSGNPFMGAVKEMIFYLSDQSANRPAIEANINNQYDIY